MPEYFVTYTGNSAEAIDGRGRLIGVSITELPDGSIKALDELGEGAEQAKFDKAWELRTVVHRGYMPEPVSVGTHYKKLPKLLTTPEFMEATTPW